MSYTAYAARMTKCECGHEGIAHYDSHGFCTWSMEGKCECEEFRPVGPEVFVQIVPRIEEETL